MEDQPFELTEKWSKKGYQEWRKPVADKENNEKDRVVLEQVRQVYYDQCTGHLDEEKEYVELKVYYERKLYLPTEQLAVGRFYPRCFNLTRASKDLRAYLCKEYYDDIDISNCQPTILAQWAERKGIRCTILQLLVDDRETVLEQVLIEGQLASRDEAKKAVIGVLYGATPETITLMALSSEADKIGDSVLAEHPYYEALARRWWSCPDKARRVALAYWAQTVESHILYTMVTEAQMLGGSVGAAIFDGFLIEKGHNINLRDLEQAVERENNYKIKLAVKPWAKGSDHYEPQPFELHDGPPEIDRPRDEIERVMEADGPLDDPHWCPSEESD